MPLIPFAKMQGVGNDFVVVDANQITGLTPSEIAPILCDRHAGVGGDGLLVIGGPDLQTQFSFRMHNPDGTPDMCGNGLRCAVLYAVRKGLIDPDTTNIQIATIDGMKNAEILDLETNYRSAQVKVGMGRPKYSPNLIPFTGRIDQDKIVNHRLEVGGAEYFITSINTGSTHSMIFVDELPADDLFFSVSPLLENHPDFPERTSVIWTKQVSPTELDIRIWERGAGETLGCGTGACAAAGAAIVKGLASDTDTIHVRSKGGILSVDWPQEQDQYSKKKAEIFLSGPAVWVFDGEVSL